MITVLMPAFNNGRFIVQAVRSILNQSFTNYELMIIDDGSEDDTESLINYINDPRIKYIRKEHTGLMDSINYGFEKSSNEIITRMDADDLAHPLRLQKQMDFFKSHPDIDLLSSWYAVFKNDRIRYVVNRSIYDEEIKKNLALYSDICHPSIMFRKSKFLKLGGFKVDARYDIVGDYFIWLKYKSHLKFYNLPQVLYFYREREDSGSNLNKLQNYKMIYEIQSSYYGEDLSDQFGLTDKQALIVRGWREFLYGDPQKSLNYWKRSDSDLLISPSVFPAVILSRLPDFFVNKIKGRRIPERLKYFTKCILPEYRRVNRDFQSIFKAVSDV